MTGPLSAALRVHCDAVVIVEAQAEADRQIMQRNRVLRVKRFLLHIGVAMKIKQTATPRQVIWQ